MRRRLAVLIDFSGTLHIEDQATEGAVSALEKLRQIPGVKLKFVTNTTKESGRALHERLEKIGFKISRNEIFSSMTAARRLVEKRNLRPLLLLEDVALEDFHGITTSDPNAVVVGLAPTHFNSKRMNEAFNLVMNGAPLIGIHKGRYFKQSSGLCLGPGPFITALEYATDTQAEVVGKPQKEFFLSALSSFNSNGDEFEPEEAIMIGDDVRDDVDGAQKAGMRGILVKTGKYKQKDEEKIDNRPWKLVENFAEAVNVIQKHMVSL